jgi:hypothetical protein
MSLQDKLIIFGMLVVAFFCSGLLYGNIQKSEAALDNLKEKIEMSQKCTNGHELIATMEDGAVNLYKVTSCIYYEGTRWLARRDICYVTVGELHGKTVAMECK